MNSKHTCPSCGFIVFESPVGSYDICPFCGWEDDHVQARFPRMTGGANGGSLFEYQKAAIKEFPLELDELDGVLRDPEWRQLTPADFESSAKTPETGLQYFEAALNDGPDYYWKK